MKNKLSDAQLRAKEKLTDEWQQIGPSGVYESRATLGALVKQGIAEIEVRRYYWDAYVRLAPVSQSHAVQE